MKINVYLRLNEGVHSIPEKYQDFLSKDINSALPLDNRTQSIIYSFSQLTGTVRNTSGDFSPKGEFVWFEFSSPIIKLFNEIIKNIIINRFMVNNSLIFSHYEIIDEKLDNCSSNYAFFTSLSPITIYDKCEKHRTYFMPLESNNMFKNGFGYNIIYDTSICIDKIKSILLHNIKKCNVDIDYQDFDIELIHTYKHKNYVAKCDNDKIIRTFGFFGYIKINASPKILSLISDIGLGNSTGLGFGHIKRNK